ncbi:hypothetical protein BJP25_20655 [Actinokineospora bangkokensis]|uniref:HSP18 transcriptional regulator n=1 Tax=Actinokineospora bangkokensis TaxID=1193682 RepID=A0A1Q9LL06_9PSEU|nr:hypothetical protein BJP25_20655 [Actinokineospora bangkokensis]
MEQEPDEVVRGLVARLGEARSGTADPEELLSALAQLRELREEMAGWEPELIQAARAAGASWAALAPALGVASRQAAERRFLRLHPETGEQTAEGRVHARRDQRAVERATSAWAQDNAAALRTLAARILALADLDNAARRHAARVGEALGGSDPARLVGPLVDIRTYLVHHPALAEQVDAVVVRTTRIRHEITTARRDGRG